MRFRKLQGVVRQGDREGVTAGPRARMLFHFQQGDRRQRVTSTMQVHGVPCRGCSQADKEHNQLITQNQV
jgi:hypothetical protein